MTKHSIKAITPKKIASHKELKSISGQKIPQSKLTKSLFSLNPKMGKTVTFNRTLSGHRKTKGV
jgi:hypothetical protein